MSAMVDLGAGGVVTAEKFAVEVELGPIFYTEGEGKTVRLDDEHETFESAEKVATDLAKFEGEVVSGISPIRPVVQAYVVTADGSEV